MLFITLTYFLGLFIAFTMFMPQMVRSLNLFLGNKVEDSGKVEKDFLVTGIFLALILHSFPVVYLLLSM